MLEIRKVVSNLSTKRTIRIIEFFLYSDFAKIWESLVSGSTERSLVRMLQLPELTHDESNLLRSNEADFSLKLYSCKRSFSVPCSQESRCLRIRRLGVVAALTTFSLPILSKHSNVGFEDNEVYIVVGRWQISQKDYLGNILCYAN